MNNTLMRNIIPADRYEAVFMETLVGVGLDADTARNVAAGRWPMSAGDALSEIRRRGLSGLTRHDLSEYLLVTFSPSTSFVDGAPIEADGIGWNRKHLEGAIVWATENGRGTVHDHEPGGVGLMPPNTTVGEMFEALRSEDLVVRVRGGCTLGATVGMLAAKVGWTREQLAGISQIANPLMGRAMAGDAEEIPHLERLVKEVMEGPRPVVTPENTFDMLRSETPSYREAAARSLAVGLGLGLSQTDEHPTDVEHLVIPPLVTLLERAVDGDTAAADELERKVTSNPALAFTVGKARKGTH